MNIRTLFIAFSAFCCFSCSGQFNENLPIEVQRELIRSTSDPQSSAAFFREASAIVNAFQNSPEGRKSLLEMVQFASNPFRLASDGIFQLLSVPEVKNLILTGKTGHEFKAK